MDAITEFKEARSVSVFLHPKKTNYIANPSFEGDGLSAFNDWDFTETVSQAQLAVDNGTTYDGPVGARTSNYKLEVVGKSSGTSLFSTFVDISPLKDMNQVFTFSIYIRANTAVPITLTLHPTDHDAYTHQQTIDTTWTRLSVSGKMPASSDPLSPVSTATLSVSWSLPGVAVFIDAAQFEIGDYATDYFDGSMASSGAAWTTGIPFANNTPSVMYPGKQAKIAQLTQVMGEFVPLNLPYFISYIDNELVAPMYKGIAL